MRAIIIQDTDAVNLLDLLKLEKFNGIVTYHLEAQDAWASLPQPIRNILIEKMHAKFHYIVCRWLQEQGANVTR